MFHTEQVIFDFLTEHRETVFLHSKSTFGVLNLLGKWPEFDLLSRNYRHLEQGCKPSETPRIVRQRSKLKYVLSHSLLDVALQEDRLFSNGALRIGSLLPDGFRGSH